jgi:cytochrome c oxidase subunit I+III
MVASPPFDGQAHDSYFVVAHFHYVLIGGVVFPVFAGIQHWFGKFTGRMAGERAGKTAFWLMFVGFNVTFFPQHWLGLQGMARRVYTYASDLGWDAANTISSIGAFAFALGVGVYVVNLAVSSRRGALAGPDPWGADSLEWSVPSPPPSYDFREQPVVTSASPLWEEAPAELDEETRYALAALNRPHRGRREVVRTSVLDARPEAVVALPGPTLRPLVAAAALGVLLVGVLVDWYPLAAVGLIATVAAIAGWLWSNREEA